MYELREWQKKAYSLIKKQSGIVVACTGSGKTAVALQLIYDNPKSRILVVVPTVVLQQQWSDEIYKTTGLVSAMIGGGHRDYPSGVTIAVINSLQKVNLSSAMARFDHVIYDECHRYASENSLQVIANLNCPHRLGLTATLERPDGSHKYLLKYIGPVVYNMPLTSTEGKQYVSQYKVESIPLDLTEKESLEYKTRNKVFLEGFKKYDYNISKMIKSVGRSGLARKTQKAMISRKEIIQTASAKLEKTIELVKEYINHKILIFDESKENAERIYQSLLSENISVGLYHSGISKKERVKTMAAYKTNKLSVLVTVRALDEGMDVPNVNVAIIVNGNRQKRQIIQRLGRAIRKEEGKVAKLIMLYCLGTHEGKIMIDRLKALK